MRFSRWLEPGVWSVAVALLAAPATAQPCDYVPTGREVVLNTNYTVVSPPNCAPYGVSGGVFVFRNVHIPAGVTVRGVGTNPMIWVVTGDFTVDGTLSVDGADGQRVNTLSSPNFPTPGGTGACSGGDGGLGSPSVVGHSTSGEAGFGPNQTPNVGGSGGRLSCDTSCNRGSGGAGGVFATAGDPYYKRKAGANNSFIQQLGFGGYGCLGSSGASQRNLPGGRPGLSVFADSNAANDFFGLGVDLARRRIFRGELALPVGGAGGGGGGDRSTICGAFTTWLNDNKGGGAGGGGGALIIVAAGKIEVTASGRVSANGGHGGGGEQAGGNNQGGGGGGGSGGMLILYADREIVLHTHGETYANNDYDFVLSADGGIGTQGRFGGLEFTAKYPPPASGSQWDNNPSGGFGGLGVIELITRPGTNPDATNTILDDNVRIMSAGMPLIGLEKMRYLAWRGFPDRLGANHLDDAGHPVLIGDDEGDIRPSPILLPILP